MRLPCPAMPTFTDNVISLGNDAADARIRLGGIATEPREFEGPSHDSMIRRGKHTGHLVIRGVGLLSPPSGLDGKRCDFGCSRQRHLRRRRTSMYAIRTSGWDS